MRSLVVLAFGGFMLLSSVAGAAHRDHATQAARGYQALPKVRGARGPVQMRLLTMAEGQRLDGHGHATLASWMPSETNALQIAGVGKTRVRTTQRPTLWDPTGTNHGNNYTTPGLHTKVAYATAEGDDEVVVQIPVSFHHHLPGDQFADSNTYTLELRTHVGTADETMHRMSGIASAGRITPVTLKGDLGRSFHLTMWPEGSGGLSGYLNGRTISGDRE